MERAQSNILYISQSCGILLCSIAIMVNLKRNLVKGKLSNELCQKETNLDKGGSCLGRFG